MLLRATSAVASCLGCRGAGAVRAAQVATLDSHCTWSARGRIVRRGWAGAL